MRGVGWKAAMIAAAGAFGFAPLAAAQTVHFVGTNIACFYTTGPACTPSGTPTTVVLDGSGLSYVGSTFDAFTSNGYLGIGNVPATPNVNNLGSFTLANGNYNFITNPLNFVMHTTFTQPGSANAFFNAMVTGSISSNGSGGATVMFTGPPQTFAFAGGTFTYSVNNVALVNGGTVPVTGQITVTASTVPEPASLLLLATGLIGLAPVLRWRRHS